MVPDSVRIDFGMVIQGVIGILMAGAIMFLYSETVTTGRAVIRIEESLKHQGEISLERGRMHKVEISAVAKDLNELERYVDQLWSRTRAHGENIKTLRDNVDKSIKLSEPQKF